MHRENKMIFLTSRAKPETEGKNQIEVVGVRLPVRKDEKPTCSINKKIKKYTHQYKFRMIINLRWVPVLLQLPVIGATHYRFLLFHTHAIKL